MRFSIYKLRILPCLVALGILTLFSGCKDWIDVQPENELTQDEFWKTTDDLMSVVASSYDAMRQCTEKSLLFGEIRADHTTTTQDDYVSISENEISITNDKVKWGEYYSTINLANTVMYFGPIVQGSDKTLTDEILEDIESEMLFLRSLSYFYLVRVWKEVPLVLTPTISDTVNFYHPKVPEYITLNQIISDLERANELASTDTKDNGRVNKYGIQALLADVLLWSEKYTECISTCDLLINSGRFSLEPGTEWFNLYYPGNSPKESIFEIQYDDNIEAQENPIWEWPNLLNNLNVATGKIGYDLQNDVRFCDGEGPKWKFTGKDANITGTERTNGEHDVNHIYYRYSDILMIKAEALAELNRFDEANQLVNEVSERAGVTFQPAYDIKTFRSTFLEERGREFATEGKRWFDILRTGKRNNFENKQLIIDIMLSKVDNAQDLAIMRTKVLDTMSYYLPIHKEEVQYNGKLVQNPFYDR